MRLKTAFAIGVFFLLSREGFSQGYSASNKNQKGRLYLGWNYYSEASSLNPLLNSVSNYGMLNYRVFDTDGQTVKFQIRTDFYQKNSFSSAQTVNRSEQFDNRYILRQLYASYTVAQGEVKAGRMVPVMTNIDVYPINGAVAENLLIAKHWRMSAFAGKIFDEYSNKQAGLGYDAGGSIAYEDNSFLVGTGYTAEQLRLTKLTKAYLFGEYRPTASWRISSRNQYVINQSLLGYSQNTVYYRFTRTLSARAFAEYHDRRAYAPAPTDSSSVWDRYFFTSKEIVIGGSLRYQVFQRRRIGSLDVIPLFKKRIGNDDLTYGSLQLNYHNYWWAPFNAGLAESYTTNQWLDNFKSSVYWNKDYLDGKMDLTASVAVSLYKWNTQTTSSNKLLSTVSLDMGYRFAPAWDLSFGIYEEAGDATDPHSGANLRIYYYLR